MVEVEELVTIIQQIKMDVLEVLVVELVLIPDLLGLVIIHQLHQHRGFLEDL